MSRPLQHHLGSMIYLIGLLDATRGSAPSMRCCPSACMSVHACGRDDLWSIFKAFSSACCTAGKSPHVSLGAPGHEEPSSPRGPRRTEARPASAAAALQTSETGAVAMRLPDRSMLQPRAATMHVSATRMSWEGDGKKIRQPVCCR